MDGKITYKTEKINAAYVLQHEYKAFNEYDLYVDYFATLNDLMDFIAVLKCYGGEGVLK